MSFQALLKTHQRIDRTPEFEGKLNPYKVHGNTPQIWEIIAGSTSWHFDFEFSDEKNYAI